MGGSTWNVARVLARLGMNSAFAGAVSKDVFGQALASASKTAGLDPRFLQIVDQPPLLAVVHELVPPTYFFIGKDSADLYFDDQLLPAGWDGYAACVHFGGISLARDPLASRLLALAARLKKAGVMISYDPNFRAVMTPAYDRVLRTMTELADIVKVSNEDPAGLFRHDDIEASFDKLRRWNRHATFLFTRGAQGASLYRNDAAWVAPVPPVQVKDSSSRSRASIPPRRKRQPAARQPKSVSSLPSRPSASRASTT